MSEKIIVDCGFVPSIIAAWPSGVVYTQQTGGVSCNHPSLEGFMIPLPLELRGADWDFCMSVTDEEADRVEREVNASLRWWPDVLNFRVIRTEENEEAWIHCAFDLQDNIAADGSRVTRAMTGVLDLRKLRLRIR